MSNTKSIPATKEQLSQLREPAALAALETLKQNGWLAVDARSLDRVFAAEPSHPAKAALEEEARNGGAFALLQFAVLIGFTACAILLSSVAKNLTPTLFVEWGALGVCAGLLVRRYPGRLYGKRRARA
jgi:hypothetical protein